MEAVAHDDPDAAAEIAESMQVPMARSQAYLMIAMRLDPTPANRARRLALIDQAFLQAKAVKDGDKRLVCLGRSPTSARAGRHRKGHPAPPR